MEIHLKRNRAAEIMLPMVDSSVPASLKSGLTVTDTAYYKDGAGSWTALPIIDTFTEIGGTGLYTIEMTAGELNHDLIMIKCAVSGAADSVVVIRTFAVDVDDLVRSTIPANTLDVEAGGTAGLDFNNTNGTHPKDAEIDAIKTKTDNLPADTSLVLNRILGLDQENFYLDNTVYDGNDNLTSGRIRIYSDAASVGTASNVIATYTITAVYSSGQLTSYKVTKQ